MLLATLGKYRRGFINWSCHHLNVQSHLAFLYVCYKQYLLCEFFLYLFQDNVAENLVGIDDKFVNLEKRVCPYQSAYIYALKNGFFWLKQLNDNSFSKCDP